MLAARPQFVAFPLSLRTRRARYGGHGGLGATRLKKMAWRVGTRGGGIQHPTQYTYTYGIHLHPIPFPFPLPLPVLAALGSNNVAQPCGHRRNCSHTSVTVYIVRGSANRSRIIIRSLHITTSGHSSPATFALWSPARFLSHSTSTVSAKTANTSCLLSGLGSAWHGLALLFPTPAQPFPTAISGSAFVILVNE